MTLFLLVPSNFWELILHSPQQLSHSHCPPRPPPLSPSLWLLGFRNALWPAAPHLPPSSARRPKTLSSETNLLFTQRQTGRYYGSCRHTLIFLPTSAGRLCQTRKCFSGPQNWRQTKKHRVFGTVKALGITVGLNQRASSRAQETAPWQPQTSEPEGENSLGGGRANPQRQTH